MLRTGVFCRAAALLLALLISVAPWAMASEADVATIPIERDAPTTAPNEKSSIEQTSTQTPPPTHFAAEKPAGNPSEKPDGAANGSKEPSAKTDADPAPTQDGDSPSAPTTAPEPLPTASEAPTDKPTKQPIEPDESDRIPTPEPTMVPDATPDGGTAPVPVPSPSSDPSPAATVWLGVAPTPGALLAPVPPPTPEVSAPENTPAPVDVDEEARTGPGDGSGLKIASSKPREDWTGVVPAADGGMPIPRMYQYNYRTVLCHYNGRPRSVSTSGCNVTSVAMVAAYLTGEKHSPEKMFAWALVNGLYSGNGLGHAEMSRVAANYGVSGKWIGRDGDAVIEALKAGKPVIAHMGPGLFARRGHYIVLRGVTKDGKILVNDSSSAHRSGLAFPMSTILKQTRNSTPFMVCGI